MRETCVIDVATGRPVGATLEVDGLLTDAALSPDDRSAATVYSTASTNQERYAGFVPEGRAGALRLWDWRTGKPLGEPLLLPSEPRSVSFSPDGRLVVVMCGGGQVLLIYASGGKVLHRLEPSRATWS